MEEVERDYMGYDIAVWQDYHYEFDDYDDDVFIIASHRDFYKKRDGFDPLEIYQSGKQFYQGYHAIPLYAYIHGGVTISITPFSCPWDSCQVGYVMVKRQKGWSWKRDDAIVIANHHALQYDQALQGEVYGVSIYKDDELYDTIHSIVGSEDHAFYRARLEIDKWTNKYKSINQ